MSTLRERTLWFFGLLGLLGSSGCIIGDGGDEQAFVVGWDTSYVGSNDRITCAQAGTSAVRLTMVSRSTHLKTVHAFNCDDGGGQGPRLATGTYDVKIALENAAGVEVSNKEGTFDIVRHGLTDMGVISFQVQSFHLSWSLARGPMSLACQDVDASRVNIVTRLNSEPEVIYSFPCAVGSGSTPAILQGTYSVRLQLLDSRDRVLWDTSTPMTISVNGVDPAVLPPVVFNNL
jgi:hypothetical protein